MILVGQNISWKTEILTITQARVACLQYLPATLFIMLSLISHTIARVFLQNKSNMQPRGGRSEAQGDFEDY